MQKLTHFAAPDYPEQTVVNVFVQANG